MYDTKCNLVIFSFDCSESLCDNVNSSMSCGLGVVDSTSVSKRWPSSEGPAEELRTSLASSTGMQGYCRADHKTSTNY